MDANRTVAVIGAGHAGLVAAKHMLAVGITPTIFDKSPGIGGMWNPEFHPSWKSFRTNVSRYTCSYSDFPWPEDCSPSMFPTQAEMGKYLKAYASTFIPGHSFQLETTVTSVRKTATASEKPWTVEWTQQVDGRTTQKVASFDHIIIATGFFSNRHIPSIPIENFSGTVIHSEEYRSAEPFHEKRVVVIGSSFSSAEICADLCHRRSGVAHSRPQQVINIVSTPFWAIPRYLPVNPEDPATPFIPVDMAFYRRTGRSSFKETVIKSAAEYQASNQYFRKVCGHGQEQGSSDDDTQGQGFEPPQDGSTLPFVAISDDYLPCIRSGLVTTRSGRIQGASGSTVTLEDGSKITGVDVIIFCTGFRPEFPFLSPEALDAISFSATDSFSPVLLDKAMTCPALPGVAFVGIYRGPYFLIAELQAMWAAKLFSKGELIQIAEQEEGILVEEQIRTQTPRPQFPHSDYLGFASSLAEKIDIFQTEALIKERPLFMPADFCLDAEMASTAAANLNAEYQKHLAGKMVAGAVFRALAGSWTVAIDPIGSAQTPTSTPTTYNQHFRLEDLSADDGFQCLQVVNVDGESKSPGRGFVQGWRYDAMNDQLWVKVKQDGCQEGSESQFLPLRFLAPDSEWEWEDEISQLPEQHMHLFTCVKGWKAIMAAPGRGSSSRTYKCCFLFQFTGILLSNMQILAERETETAKKSSNYNYELLFTLKPQNQRRVCIK